MSGIDLNRAGVPLLEIVSEPDMRSAEEAVAYARALHFLVVEEIEICDGNMQEGSFRCDANVSVRRPGGPLGTRAEIKNLNSFRFLERAIEFDASGRSRSWKAAGRSCRRRACMTPTATRRARCAPRKRRTTTGIFQIRIYRLWW